MHRPNLSSTGRLSESEEEPSGARPTHDGGWLTHENHGLNRTKVRSAPASGRSATRTSCRLHLRQYKRIERPSPLHHLQLLPTARPWSRKQAGRLGLEQLLPLRTQASSEDPGDRVSRDCAETRKPTHRGEAAMNGVPAPTHGCPTGLRPVHVGRPRATRETQSAATRPDGSISRQRQDLHFVNRRYLRSSKRHAPHGVRVQMPVSPYLPYPRPCLNHDRGNPRNRKGTASAVPQTPRPPRSSYRSAEGRSGSAAERLNRLLPCCRSTPG